MTRSDGPDQLCGPGGGRLLPVQSIPGKQGPRTGGRGGAGRGWSPALGDSAAARSPQPCSWLSKLSPPAQCVAVCVPSIVLCAVW